MTIEKMDFADGKYTVCNDSGRVTALRHGEPWRDLTGDNLVYWMLVDSLKLEAQRDALLEVVQEFIRKVDSGDARSVRSYEAMKSAVELCDIELNSYRVWPDGTAQRTEFTPYSHMSDDFTIVYATTAEKAIRKALK